MGGGLPLEWGRWAARLHPRLSYLLTRKGDFVIPDYLGEFSVHIDGRYIIEREMFSGAYEPHCLEIIRQHVKSGDICVDVGANVGAVALYLSRLVGPRGQVHCVEPGPENLRRLKANFQLNPSLQNATFHAFGLSDKTERRMWGEDADNPGNGGFLSYQTTEVEVRTLDSLALPRLDFIKIDTEGMEYQVLKGGEHTLRQHRPKILLETLMVFEDHLGTPVRKHSEELLHALGYRLFSFEDGDLREVRYPNFPDNVLALPAGEHA